MNKKKKVLILSICVLSIVFISFMVYKVSASRLYKVTELNKNNTISYVYDENINISEPQRTSDIPSYVKWEPMLACYISEELEYNNETKSFDEKLPENEDYDESRSYREEEWKKENINSTNKLYQAILRYEKERMETIGFSSIYDMKEDPAFISNIVDLGIEYVPEMLGLMFEEKILNWQMASAIECLTGVKCIPDESMLDDFKVILWEKNFKDYIANIESMVANEVDIERLGMFALPYIYKEIQNGNMQYKSYVPLIVTNIDSKSVDEWFIDNIEIIEIIEYSIESIR